MKKHYLLGMTMMLGIGLLFGCETREMGHEEEYLEVIGEYEQQTPEAGYRLNLSYNGPVELRKKFDEWADSLQQEVPTMVKTSENIYLNHMPEQRDRKVSRDMYHTSVTYLLTVSDSTLYSKIMQDLIEKNIPFNLNVMGTFMNPELKGKLQQEMLQKALENARAKLDFMSGEERTYEIVGIEELDNTTPYGPEYYDFNRRMIARLKVKARLQ